MLIVRYLSAFRLATPNYLMYNEPMQNDVRYCVKFKHFLALAACWLLGLYALLDTGNLFGLFAVMFTPPVYVLLLVLIASRRVDVSWC